MTKFKQFMWNGILITLVSLLIRSVAVSFNVYLSNRIGAVTMGLFTLISTVYGFAITVATSGIGLATTRLVAEAAGMNAESARAPQDNPRVICTVRKCTVYALCFSFGSAAVLFLFAPLIGERLLHDSRTILPLQILAFTLPPIAFSSVLSGYFTAVRRVYKNAVVQVVGQVIRIYACILFVGLFTAKDVEGACVAVVLGGALSEVLSFLLQWILYRLEKKKHSDEKIGSGEKKKIERKIFQTALPVAFSAYVRSGLVTIEHMLIPWGLERSGNSRDQSLASYGVVHSMVFPLVLFPSALSGSFAGLLVPEIAESVAVGDRARVGRIIQRVFHAVLVFAIGCAGIMMCFSYELGSLIYPNTNASKYILMVAPLIPVMYLDTSTDSILKGMGEQVYCMGVNIVDSFLSVILVWILLPQCGINGYIITVYFTEIVNATLSIYRLFSVTKVKTHLMNWVIKPMLSIVVATWIIRWLLRYFHACVDSPWQLTAHIILTVLLYFVFLILTGSVKIKELLSRVE
ncbi:MAG: polysaccharide biosynthesis C-terminal domain-containing protein [Clostridia bacterium]|nr:polysaccharide biosynthesis C-terminal domain-containing protein [Clostridia bacterium]